KPSVKMGWSNVLLPYTTHPGETHVSDPTILLTSGLHLPSPENFGPDVVRHFDDDIVVIYDKFPKAQLHLLIMPRKSIPNYAALSREDLPLLSRMHSYG